MKQNVFRLIFLSAFLYCGTAFGAVTSLDNTFAQNDVYSADFSSRLNRNFNQVLTGGVNSVDNTNVSQKTLLADPVSNNFADESSPVVRTNEGAACPNYVFAGLLPATGPSLTTYISAGTGYPYGYRVSFASGVAHTYDASVWTWVDLDTSGNFHYTDTAFNSSAPAVYNNSMRLAVVSSDATTVNTVTDLRTTSCTTGNLSNFTNAVGESSIDDILKNGIPQGKLNYVGGATSQGFFQGAAVSYGNQTSFNVAPGSILINGHYRTNSTVTSVPTSSNIPTLGISGINSGSPVQNTVYKVYAVADKIASKNFSVSFGTAPAGLVNYREIGQIQTASSDSGFVSQDVASVFSQDYTAVQQGIVNNQSSFTISNLQAGSKYKLVFNVNQTSSAGYYTVRVNGDSGSNYTYAEVFSSSSVNGGNSASATAWYLDGANTADAGTGFASGELFLQPKNGNANAVASNWNLYGYASSVYVTAHGGGQYLGVAPATSITILTSAGSMNGNWYLYQIS